MSMIDDRPLEIMITMARYRGCSELLCAPSVVVSDWGWSKQPSTSSTLAVTEKAKK
jgi:hypothetical protein